jgi:hypothetical protein
VLSGHAHCADVLTEWWHDTSPCSWECLTAGQCAQFAGVLTLPLPLATGFPVVCVAPSLGLYNDKQEW